jgi:hypothetical protein
MICITCKKNKDETEFHYKSKRNNIRQKHCSSCQKIYQRKNYLKYRNYYLERSKKQRETGKLRRDEIKKKQKCKKCGIDHPAVLEFHHLDPSIKEGNLSGMWKSHSINTIEREIEKCVVLCSNCHKIEHWNLNNKLV